LFELDARERGNFQHDVLDRFHRELASAGRRWRDLTPEAARQRIAEIVEELANDESYRSGLMKQSGQTLFAARVLAEPLQDFVGTLVGWMRGQYDFDPLRSEFDFGFNRETGGPAWEVRLDERHALALRGRIDRIDVFHENGRTLVAVMDYKSSQKKLDPLRLANGLQLQLPAYLAAIGHWPPERLGPDVGEIIPAGMFYVNLRGETKSVSARNEETGETENPGQTWRHSGRFDATWLPHFDHRPGVKKGSQFKFSMNKDGTLSARTSDAKPAAEFRQMLVGVEASLRELGRGIYPGRVAVDPFQKGFETACDQCEYQSICRIDKWTQTWRQLRPAGPDAEPEE
jgi:ATP-dependent helicase/nuclease subunit B